MNIQKNEPHGISICDTSTSIKSLTLKWMNHYHFCQVMGIESLRNAFKWKQNKDSAPILNIITIKKNPTLIIQLVTLSLVDVTNMVVWIANLLIVWTWLWTCLIISHPSMSLQYLLYCFLGSKDETWLWNFHS